MLRYTVKRLLATIPVMALVALFVFSLLYISPGDPASVIAGEMGGADEAAMAAIRRAYGLDRPLPE